MNLQGLDRDKCLRRNHIAGLRGNVESTPLRFVRAEEPSSLVAARGVIPTGDAALAKINAKIPGPSLTQEHVYLHQMEAASTRYIGDRYMFLHPSTLKNIVAGADAGFAFMNSHRTGDLSTPSELPFGRAYAGSYQTLSENGAKIKRAMVGVYMLRGQAPNGANGPTTDALDAAINGGTIFDVSMGLYGGWRMCDLCQCDLNARDAEGNYICPHVPGTHRKMTKDQRTAQAARGVPDGMATYSLMDASPAEVSAVYDGAIPGAGFSKARRLARGNRFSRTEWREALSAYPSLVSSPGPKEGPTMPGLSIRQWLGMAPSVQLTDDHDPDRDHDDEPMPPRRSRVVQPGQFSVQDTTPPVTPPSPVVAQLQAQIEQLQAARLQESNDRIDAEAERFASDAVRNRKAVPSERQALAAMYGQLARDDRDHPVANAASRTQLYRNMVEARTEHNLTREITASDPRYNVLTHDSGTTEDEEIKAAVKSAQDYARKMNGTSSK